MLVRRHSDLPVTGDLQLADKEAEWWRQSVLVCVRDSGARALAWKCEGKQKPLAKKKAEGCPGRASNQGRDHIDESGEVHT